MNISNVYIPQQEVLFTVQGRSLESAPHLQKMEGQYDKFRTFMNSFPHGRSESGAAGSFDRGVAQECMNI